MYPLAGHRILRSRWPANLRLRSAQAAEGSRQRHLRSRNTSAKAKRRKRLDRSTQGESRISSKFPKERFVWESAAENVSCRRVPPTRVWPNYLKPSAEQDSFTRLHTKLAGNQPVRSDFLQLKQSRHPSFYHVSKNPLAISGLSQWSVPFEIPTHLSCQCNRPAYVDHPQPWPCWFSFS